MEDKLEKKVGRPAIGPTMVMLKCAMCGIQFERESRNIHGAFSNRYCTRKCQKAGRAAKKPFA